MNPLDWLGGYKWLACFLFLAAFGGYMEYRGYQNAEAKFTQEASDAKIESDKIAKDLQGKLDAAKNTQELKDVDHEKTVAALSAELRRSAGAAARLRDPHAAACPAGAVAIAPGAGPDDGAQAGGLLSAELTELLQRLTREADDINNAYASCRADSISVRVLQPH